MPRLTDEESAAWNRLRVLNEISDSERQLLSHIESLEAEIDALREDKRLAVATALGEAAELPYKLFPSDSIRKLREIKEAILGLIHPADRDLVVAHNAAIRAEVFDQFADIALSVYGIEAGTHTPASLLQAVREQALKQIQPWLLHDDECAKLTNDDGVKCTCGLDESVCALMKGGSR